ncbi:DNA glycosylase [Xylariaceae sp. FL0255]|nr:DNA glycosylase [Xylariaceae sp. FL0255]
MRRSSRLVRQASPSLLSASSAEQVNEEGASSVKQPNSTRGKRAAPPTPSDASKSDDDEYQVSEQEITAKKRKISGSRAKKGQKNDNAQTFEKLFGADKPVAQSAPCDLPKRIHNVNYHRPLLLDNRQGRTDLLNWFDGVSTLRSMPWRKAWIDPRSIIDAAELRKKLERRAYEVWISEIMLQQTRVAVVIDYWNRWMAKWPTIHELAAADPDEVLAMWRGLGYYSRATRIHEAAKKVCEDQALHGVLPSRVDELVKMVPGVGRYTAGAISAIVFGKASPMVDGNVLRVLSRQMGVYGDVKTDKVVIDLLWAAADSLVNAVALDLEDGEPPQAVEGELVSDRPGRWGQALMELGSTICTPKPLCTSCPINESCRAYGEGLQLAAKKGLAPKDLVPHANSRSSSVTDIEDACNFCQPFEEADDTDDNVVVDPSVKKTAQAEKSRKGRVVRQQSLSLFFPTVNSSTKPAPTEPTEPPEITEAGQSVIVNHARKFPLKVVKKAVREQDTFVCAIRRPDGRYLLHRRPQKGLLAGLWEFPNWEVPEDLHEFSPANDKWMAELHASAVLDPALRRNSRILPFVKFVKRLGTVPWLFSHLKLKMHVFLFELKASEEEIAKLPETGDRWSEDVEAESMGTGMRRCWELVRDAEDG